jgi:hypothetical protein
MTVMETLTEDRASSALHAINQAYEILGYLIRDDDHGKVRVLAECAVQMIDEATGHLDRPFPNGGAS